MGSYLLMSFSGIHLIPAVRFNLIYFFPNPRSARMWHLKWVGMDCSNWRDLCCSIKVLHGSTHIWHWFIINGSFQDVLIFFLSDMLSQRPDRTLTLNDPREMFQAPPTNLSISLRCICLLGSEFIPADRKFDLREVLNPFKLLARPSVFLPAISGYQ